MQHNAIRLFLLISIVFINLKTYGQHNGKWIVKGIITDTAGKGLPSTTVAILRGVDSALIKGVISDEFGKYQFNHLLPGNYLVNATLQGYNNGWSGNITTDSSATEMTLPAIKLSPETKNLREVIIAAKKPLFEQKTDRMIVNVASSITAAGSSVLDILERSPGVIVDRQNSLMSLQGKDGVVVMFDDKINHMSMDAVIQLLAGMNSGNVEKIELISTPPARYDAQGNAGFINIVMKKNIQFGTNGSYSLTLGYSKGEIEEASLNFNHRKGSINLYGDISFSGIQSYQFWSFYHKTDNNGEVTETNTAAPRDYTITNFTGRAGLDYELNKNTVIGILFSGSTNLVSINSYNSGTVSINQQVDTIMQLYDHEIHNLYNENVNINLDHSFNINEKLTANLDYMHYLDDNPVKYLYSFYDPKRDFLYSQKLSSTKLTPITFWVAKLDYSKKLGDHVDWESGIKATISTFTNQVQVDSLSQNQWDEEAGFSAKYQLNENYPAAYTSLNIKVNNKTNIQAGLRYEYTNSNLGTDSVKNIVDRHYGYLFPSFSISDKINDNNSVALSYSRRITRPTFNDMAPWVIFIDPFTYFAGNPELLPAITDNVEIHYSLKKLIIGISFSYDKNPIIDFFPKVDSVNKIESLTPENMNNAKTFNISLNLPFEPTRWWSMYYSALLTWQQVNGIYNNSAIQVGQESIHITASETFKLPKNFSLVISGYYQSPALVFFYKSSAYGSLDVGIQKKFLNKGTLSFNTTNILNTTSQNLYVNLPAQNIVSNVYIINGYPTFRLTYTRNFGNEKVKEKRTRELGSEDEQGRVH